MLSACLILILLRCSLTTLSARLATTLVAFFEIGFTKNINLYNLQVSHLDLTAVDAVTETVSISIR